MKSNVGIIIEREYLSRVRKKSFIFVTLLVPILMLALGAAPTLIMIYGGSDNIVLDVIDGSGVIGSQLKSSDELEYRVIDGVSLDDALADESADGVLVIPDSILSVNLPIKVYSADGVSLMAEQNITSSVKKIVEDERLKRYNIDNLDSILEQVNADIPVQNIRVDENDGESLSSSVVSFIMGEFMTFLLYISLLLYGQMVMTSIIEEKNNRVLELIVSSVRPAQLMLGKIAGIGLVAVTQIVIWIVLMVSASAFIIPALLPEGMMAEASAAASGTLDAAAANFDIDMLQALALLADPIYILTMFVWLLLFLLGGFLLYSAIFAAIGSSVDNIQDASQLQSVVVMPIILGIIFGMQAASMPNSTLAMVMSFIPFTSPMVMLARIPFGVPLWQILISLALLLLGVIFMIWLAAKIYRVGIFMYGKKPTVKELVRWARQK